ncbi:MAG: hypothetical protein COA78_29885 [Blastopirellula sp.]|nr:MAG: hypothetical protein COA78_29885 [Blastopirellula sp.]
MKILILDSHSNAGLACIQSLGKAKHDIFSASNKESSLSNSSVYGGNNYIYPDPMLSAIEFTDWIIKFQSEFRFDFILAVTDNTIYPLMEVTDPDLDKVLILPNKATFEYAFNKEKTLLLAKKLNIPVPSNSYVTTDNFDIGDFTSYPLFVKPVQSKGVSENGSFNLQPVLVESASELSTSVNKFLKYTPVQIQQCVPGVGVGIEVLCKQGKIIRAFAHKRLHEIPLTGGGSSYRKSIPMPADLYQYSEQLMRSLNWHGVAMVEFKSENNNHWLMEINGRFWGSLPLAIHSGIDFPKLLIDMLSEKNIPLEYSYNENLYVRNILKDLDWFKLNIRADKSNPRLITHGVGLSIFEILRVFTPKEKWDHFDLRDLGVFKKQISMIVRKEINTINNKLYKKYILFKYRFIKDIPKANKILVLCYGNICRSPFVEHSLISSFNNDAYEVKSAGFHENINRNSPDYYQDICRGEGIDLENHKSVLVNSDLANWADLILLMDYKNYECAKSKLSPPNLKKCYFLGGDEKGDIEILDPYGKSSKEILAIVLQMKKSVSGFVSKILS